MPIWSLDRKGKNPELSTRDLSPNGKALATISANLAYVISSESSDGRERSVPDMVSHLVARYRQLQDLYRDLRRESDLLKDEKNTLEIAFQASQEKTQTQRDEWNNRAARYQSEIDRLKDTVTRLRQSYEEANHGISKQREDLDNALKASHHAQEQLHQSHRRNVEDIQKQNATREADLRAKYEISERQMKEEHDSAVNHLGCVVDSLEKDLEKRKKEFELETMQLKQSHKIKQDKLKDNFNMYESQLKQTHKQQQERLQKDIQSRNKALIAREIYSPITDGELKSLFSSLVREVDSLARLKWTINQSPWPDEELSKISDTPKRLQKQIMKETIWDILYEQVFCSPFRVFGTEGSVLESEWNKAFGGGKSAQPRLDRSDPNKN